MTSGPMLPQPDDGPPPALRIDTYPSASMAVKPAAIAMIVYNALSAVHGLLAIPFVVAYRAFIDEMAKQTPELRDIAELLHRPAVVVTVVALLVVGLLASILGIVGGVCMLRVRGYGLAMTAAIVTMVSPGGCCCVIGIAIGIWAMVVLMKPEVQSAFNRQ